MKNRFLSTRNLIVLALTAVVSLAAAHLTDLVAWLLGSGPTSGWVVAADLVGLAACGGSAWLGVRSLRRLRRGRPVDARCCPVGAHSTGGTFN
jgi:hypothetical protein